jgi:lipopolysaccharide/colanic/teichoic acid biosynthesis glycosyltransferase
MVDSSGGVIYKQERLGKDGNLFYIFKFRTMVSNAENIGSGLFTDGNDDRITRIGRLLRKFSLDELPQFLNILLGDMSLIGPRPPVPYHPYDYENYPRRYKVRFLHRPGISGWAQIHGRTNLSWTDRLEYDVYYHNHFSFMLDMKIIFRTIFKLITNENVYPEDINIGKNHLD